MIVNNQNQKWENHEVALCHVWNCDRLLRLDQAHTYVKPEWFGSPWAHGLDVVAICSHHIVERGESIKVLNDKPLPSAVLEVVQQVFPEYPLPEPVQHFNDKELEKLEPRVQEPEQLKEFVFRHEVSDSIFQVWLEDINQGSPHRHIGGAI